MSSVFPHDEESGLRARQTATVVKKKTKTRSQRYRENFSNTPHKIPLLILNAWFLLVVWMLRFTPVAVGDFKGRVTIWITVASAYSIAGFYFFRAYSSRLSTVQRFTSIALFIFMAFATMVQVSSYFSGWCCVNEHHLSSLCNAMTTALAHLEQNGIPYWLCYGTVMAALVAPEFPHQTFPWEHDMDVCIYARDAERVIETLRDVPDVQVVHFPLTDQFEIIPKPTDMRLTVGRAYVDLRLWDTDPDDPEFLVHRKMKANGEFYTKLVEGRFNKSNLEPFSKIQVCDKQLNAPKYQEQTTVDLFGPRERWWSTRMWPSNLQGYTCSIYADCYIPPKHYPVG